MFLHKKKTSKYLQIQSIAHIKKLLQEILEVIKYYCQQLQKDV